MKLNDYQEASREFAIYNTPLMYPCLGLAGECGELIEKLRKGADYKDTLGEVGDVLWYCANVAADVGFKLQFAALTYAAANKLESPIEFDDLGDRIMFDEPCVALAVMVGMVCENAKKIDRDCGGKIPENRRESICLTIGCIVYLLQDVAVELGSTLGKVAQANLDKLASRKERGKLKGDGDTR